MLLLVSGAALFLDQRQELGGGANGLLDILDLKASKGNHPFSPSEVDGAGVIPKIKKPRDV